MKHICDHRISENSETAVFLKLKYNSGIPRNKCSRVQKSRLCKFMSFIACSTVEAKKAQGSHQSALHRKAAVLILSRLNSLGPC